MVSMKQAKKFSFRTETNRKNLFILDTELLHFLFFVIFSAILWPSCKDFYMFPLFRFVSVRFFLFRFNRNTETGCFDIEPKQTSCFG
jgi:hypothetical protein